MEWMTEMAEFIFDLPVKRGVPIGIGGLLDVVNSPMYSTGVGLVIYGSKQKQANKFKIRDRNIYGKVRERMKEWMGELF